MSESYIVCNKCKAECKEGIKYCWSCWFQPARKSVKKSDEPSMSLGSRQFVELDKKNRELLIIKYKLVGKPEVLGGIPLSKIEGVRSLYASRIPLMVKKEDVLATINHILDPINRSLTTIALDLVDSKPNRKEGYNLDVKVDGEWGNFGHEDSAINALRTSSALGIGLENRREKLLVLADNLPNLSIHSITVAEEGLPFSDRYRNLNCKIKIKCRKPNIYWLKEEKGKSEFPFHRQWRLEGIIWLSDSPIDSVEVLCNDDIKAINSYYTLAYVVKASKTDNVWTERKSKFLSSRLNKVVWKGKSLAQKLDNDTSLRDLLMKHLVKADCDICITNHGNNTMILFGESYPRHWIRFPEEMYPSEERIELVTKLAEHIWYS